jgi:uncharacterized protein (TIGR02646 family)
MKHIQKAGAPRGYSQWCATVTGTHKADYRELPATEKQALLAALITEQGALCAYTMRRIGVDSAHVEHIKPESRCRADQPESDLDYGNMVACFPREGMQKAYRYGAQKKDNWWENEGAEFVSPLRPVCERRFRFDLNEKLRPWPTIPLHWRRLESSRSTTRVSPRTASASSRSSSTVRREMTRCLPPILSVHYRPFASETVRVASMNSALRLAMHSKRT